MPLCMLSVDPKICIQQKATKSLRDLETVNSWSSETEKHYV